MLDAAAVPADGHSGDGNVLQIVRGSRRVGMASYELQRAATGLVQAMVKPPATGALDALESQKLAEGVTYRVLYDRSALASPAQLDVTTRLAALGEQARVVHSVPTKLMIVDTEIAMLPLTTTGRTVDTAVLIRNSDLLVALKRIFDDLWRFAAPLRAAAGTERGELQPTEQERMILSLLASGATDETIGRLLGLSARTAHRRVRELIGRLGVDTRFQAGMRAVQLGWL